MPAGGNPHIPTWVADSESAPSSSVLTEETIEEAIAAGDVIEKPKTEKVPAWAISNEPESSESASSTENNTDLEVSTVGIESSNECEPELNTLPERSEGERLPEWASISTQEHSIFDGADDETNDQIRKDKQ